MQVFFNIIDNVEEEPMCFKMKKQLDALNGPHWTGAGVWFLKDAHRVSSRPSGVVTPTGPPDRAAPIL